MKIHFIWLGSNQGAHCTATPVAVAQQCPNDEVWLWVFKANARDFEAAIKNSGVKIMALDSVTGPLGAQDWVNDAFSVISTLVHYQAWVAAKDLAVVLILYKHGGLYLDTTCVLATNDEGRRYESKRLFGGVKARSLPDAVRALARSGPALPLVKDDLIDYQPGAYTVKAVTVGYDSGLEKTNPIIMMPHIDVWSYFSPAGHKIFLGAAESYVRRAKVLGLDDANSSNHTGKNELAGDFRDNVIGNLVTHSIYDGLSGALGGDPDAITKICWRAFAFTGRPANLPEGDDGAAGRDILPELGIIKQYKNSWRSKK